MLECSGRLNWIDSAPMSYLVQALDEEDDSDRGQKSDRGFGDDPVSGTPERDRRAKRGRDDGRQDDDQVAPRPSEKPDATDDGQGEQHPIEVLAAELKGT